MNIPCNGVIHNFIFPQNEFLFLCHNFVIMFCCIGSRSMLVKAHVTAVKLQINVCSAVVAKKAILQLQFYFGEFIIRNLSGCIHSMDWTTGLEYWTGILDWTTELSYYGQICVFICRKQPTFFTINEYLATMDDYNNNSSLLQCFQRQLQSFNKQELQLYV